jgi:hypothetical protein
MTADTVTAAERLAETLHRLGYLIDRHSLPAPKESRVRTAQLDRPFAVVGIVADVRLKNLHDLNRWAAVTDAAVTTVKEPEDYLHLACTVLGDVPLRLTCFGEALTP